MEYKAIITTGVHLRVKELTVQTTEDRVSLIPEKMKVFFSFKNA